MTDCRIFQIMSNVETLWDEVYRLAGHVPEAFAAPKISVKEYKKEEPIEECNSCNRIAFHFEVHGVVGRQRKPSQFVLMFDLWRQETSTTWPHAKQAFLTFAYEPRFDEGWEANQLAIDANGRIKDEESREACSLQAEDRLLEWVYGKRQWQERAWFFSIPVLKLDGPASFEREIVTPVELLLKHNKQPAAALAGTSAIAFAQN